MDSNNDKTEHINKDIGIKELAKKRKDLERQIKIDLSLRLEAFKKETGVSPSGIQVYMTEKTIIGHEAENILAHVSVTIEI